MKYDVIYLQAYYDGELLSEFKDEITWCSDMLNGDDIAFVRKEIVDQMAEAIIEWERAKEERENFVPVIGELPPPSLLHNAKKANKMLTEAIAKYKEVVGWSGDEK